MDDPTPVTPQPSEAVQAAGGSLRCIFMLALGGTLLLLTPLLVAVVLITRDGDVAPSAVAEAARPFDLPGLEGGRITQAAFTGRVVVVNVWASWCGPCREEAPVLRRMAHDASGATFYGVVRLDDPAPARAFAREQGLDYPHALDDGAFARAHRVEVLPTTLVFAADGSFVGRIEGPVSEARLRALIDDAVAMGASSKPAKSSR